MLELIITERHNVPRAPKRLHPKQEDLDPFSRFCTVKPRDRQTDWQTDWQRGSSVTIACISCIRCSLKHKLHYIYEMSRRYVAYVLKLVVIHISLSLIVSEPKLFLKLARSSLCDELNTLHWHSIAARLRSLRVTVKLTATVVFRQWKMFYLISAQQVLLPVWTAAVDRRQDFSLISCLYATDSVQRHNQQTLSPSDHRITCCENFTDTFTTYKVDQNWQFYASVRL